MSVAATGENKQPPPPPPSRFKVLESAISAAIGHRRTDDGCAGLPVPILCSIVAAYAVEFEWIVHQLPKPSKYVWTDVDGGMLYLPAPDRNDTDPDTGTGSSGGGGESSCIAIINNSFMWKVSIANAPPSSSSASTAPATDVAVVRPFARWSDEAGETRPPFYAPSVVLIDPARPNSYYFCTKHDISHLDDTTHTITPVVISQSLGEGGPGVLSVSSMLISATGDALWVVDSFQDAIVRIDMTRSPPSSPAAAAAVRTAGALGLIVPGRMIWDRSARNPPESQLWIAGALCLYRYVISSPPGGDNTGHVSGTLLTYTEAEAIKDMACTRSGKLLWISRFDQHIHSFDPATRVSSIAFTPPRDFAAQEMSALMIVESKRWLVVAGQAMLWRAELSPDCYPLVHCCERDK